MSNSGTKSAFISSISHSDGFLATNNCGNYLDPGSSCSISVQFLPVTPGTITGSLVIEGDAINTPYSVSLTGTTPSHQLSVSDQPERGVIPQTAWTLKSVDSEETVGEDGAARNAFDGDVRTIWHTQWEAASPRHPHIIEIDLGAVHNLNGFQYLPRQDGGINGRVQDYALYVSQDGVKWGSAVARGTFPNNAQQQEVWFVQTQGRYVRFDALSEVNGKPWTSVAELNLLGVGGIPTDSKPSSIDTNEGEVHFSSDFNEVKSNTVLSQLHIKDMFAPVTSGVENRASPAGVTIVADPANSGRGNSLRVFFPKGEYGNAASGAAWQTKLSPRDEYYFAFDIYIPVGFDWPLGVKLPGLFGGSLNAASGLKATNGVDGFAVRQSIYSERQEGDTQGYRSIGNGVLGANTYTYDGHTTPRIYNVNLNGSFSEAIKLIPGKWSRIEQRVVLNDATNVTGVGVKRNGIYEAWVDGVKVYSSNNWIYRQNTSLKVDHISFIWYYGGGSSDWGAREDQYMYFDNFIASTQPITH